MEQLSNIIVMPQKELLPSDWINKGRLPSKYFLLAPDPLDYFLQSPDCNSSEFYLIIHSDQNSKLSKA
jgi:hypothetical protein